MKISVLGCGRWGSFIAWYLDKINNDVMLWGRSGSKSFECLKNEGKNEYLTLNKSITLSSSLSECVDHGEIIVISIPAQKLREFLSDVVKLDIKNKKFILCMKGLEESTGKRLSEVAIESGIDKDNLAVWIGPGHIQEFLLGRPNCMVIDSNNQDLTKYLADSLKSEVIRFYYGSDLIGNEVGAASKNVIGIAGGMLDGLGLSTLKGALMSRGAREVARLIKLMGGNELSAYGLCHLGDYETTLFSQYSNNRKFGEDYVLNKPFNKLAEGVMTSKAMKFLGEKYGEELPITNAVYNIIFENKDAKIELKKLFNRTLKKEFM